MLHVRPLVGCLGLALAASGTASVGAAHTRAEHPPMAAVAVAPWLDVAITGAIGTRAARATATEGSEPPRTPVGPKRKGEAEVPRHRVDPRPHGFDFPLRGSI